MFTTVSGLYDFNVSTADCTLGFPMSSLKCRICLCKFVTSTSSNSTKPIVPTPAKVR